MDSNSDGNPRRRTVETGAPGTDVRLPTSLFNNAQNNEFSNNTFVTNVKPVAGSSLDALHRRVAPNAILNAGGRADAVRCCPGTRAEVIARIEKWRTDAPDSTMGNRIFWLSGPAGCGKTAIVQTVAESWIARGIHAANFFFFRSDLSRNTATSLVPTLLYQIFDLYPAARKSVEEILASKPRLLDASIAEQFDKLICSSLRSIRSSFSHPIVLLIDGLDECTSEEKKSQQEIVHAIDLLVSQTEVPFLVLISSRVEHQISIAFKELSSTYDPIFLDEKYEPAKDIRLFVKAEFDRIKHTHPLAPQDDWPAASDVNEIVATSSGQFIYAAIVMRFLLHSSADPQLSLARIQGTARIATKSPFSQLDAMYTCILSQAEDQDALKAVLCAHIMYMFHFIDIQVHSPSLGLIIPQTLQEILRLCDDKYTESVIRSCTADITAIACYKDGLLSLYHSSFNDYLQTPSRSGEYYCDGLTIRLAVLRRNRKNREEFNRATEITGATEIAGARETTSSTDAKHGWFHPYRWLPGLSRLSGLW